MRQNPQMPSAPALAKPFGLNPETGCAQFFLIGTPGLEPIIEKELKNWFPEVQAEVVRGGVNVTAKLAQGFAMNRVLKTPTRILMRLADFGCRDFPKLFKKISNLPWEKWIADSSQIEFQASARNSRLKMKKRIEETCNEARKARLKKRGVRPSEKGHVQTVFVRLDDDVCYLSLDLSGELLHKRGLRTYSSDAPLRETIAASLLWILREENPGINKIELVDPMTGGGTFLLEAALLDQPLPSRDYAFESLVQKEKYDLPQAGALVEFTKLTGMDVSEKALASAKENLSHLAKVPPLELISGDIMKAAKLPESKAPRWLIVNPPYGERIQIEGRLTDYYSNLLAKMSEWASPSVMCALIPQKVNPARLKLPQGWALSREVRFQNGGIPVQALVFRAL